MQVVGLLLVAISAEVWTYTFQKGAQLTLPFPKTTAQKLQELRQEYDEMKKQFTNLLNMFEIFKNETVIEQTKVTTFRKEETAFKEAQDLPADLSSNIFRTFTLSNGCFGEGDSKTEDAVKTSLSELPSKLDNSQKVNAESDGDMETNLSDLHLSSKLDNLRKDHDQLVQRVNDLQRCGPPPDVPNTNVTYEDDAVGSEATYACQPDFSQCRGDAKITCQSNRRWDKPSLMCDRSRWVNPEVAFVEPLTCGEQSKLKVVITGTPTKATQMKFELFKNLDILFHVAARFGKGGCVVLDACVNHRWMAPKVVGIFPFQLLKTFTLEITLEDGVYTVTVNGEHIGTMPEIVKGGRPDKLQIIEDLTLQKVEMLL